MANPLQPNHIDLRASLAYTVLARCKTRAYHRADRITHSIQFVGSTVRQDALK